MNRREENLIRILYEKRNQFIIINEMAEHEECSDKTIRNSLDKVEEYLNKFSSNLQLERIKGKGIRLKVEESSNITLRDILGSKAISEEGFSTNERRFEIAYALLMETKSITRKNLSKKYYVSQEIINKDLDEIGKWMEKFNLRIASKQRIGTILEGSEKDKREALARSIKSLGGIRKSRPTLRNIFMPYEIELVNKSIMDLQDEINVYFTDESSDALGIHVLFMIKRINLNQAIGVSKYEENLVERKAQYLWAIKLAENLEKKFSLKFPKDEIVYLAVNLLGMRYSGGNDLESISYTLESDSNIMDILLDRLLDNMEEILKISFKEDEMLIEGLRMHLYGSLNRIKYGLSLENPLFEDIKRNYPYIYNEAMDTIDRFHSEYHILIPKEEVAYITVHFQAAIERNNKRISKKHRAIIVCHLGIGVSNYLQIKLERLFPWMNFRGNVSVKDIRRYLKDNPVDFIFSTIDIEHRDIKYIKINSIIDKNEEDLLREEINNCLLLKESNNKKGFERFIVPEFIFLNKKLKDKAEVIEFITSKLYNKGQVKSEFHQSVLKREEIDSTEVGNLLAIPHGNTDDIISSTIGILTLESPILWENEKVQTVFLLAVKKEDYSKDDSMRRFFKYLHNLSSGKESLEVLLEGKNK